MHVILEVSGEANFHLCTNAPDDLVHIDPKDPDYVKIYNLFMNNWKHPNKRRPTVKHIFYVAHSSADALAHLSRFSNYSNTVGNTQLLFHGTTRTCTVGSSNHKAHSNLCSRDDCNLCLILQGSYDIEKAGSRSMFGNGIYSTIVSSKADHYASRRSRTGLKSIILNHVVLGRTTLLVTHDHNLQHAPEIYNSVTGATRAEGGTLEYHEAIVYREDAMCACAVIFYE